MASMHNTVGRGLKRLCKLAKLAYAEAKSKDEVSISSVPVPQFGVLFAKVASQLVHLHVKLASASRRYDSDGLQFPKAGLVPMSCLGSDEDKQAAGS